MLCGGGAPGADLFAGGGAAAEKRDRGVDGSRPDERGAQVHPVVPRSGLHSVGGELGQHDASDVCPQRGVVENLEQG